MFTYFGVGNPGWHFLFPALRRSRVTNHSVVVVYAFFRFCVFQLFNYLQIKKVTVLVSDSKILNETMVVYPNKRPCFASNELIEKHKTKQKHALLLSAVCWNRKCSIQGSRPSIYIKRASKGVKSN